MNYEYVKLYYGVNPEVGMRVTSEDGKKHGGFLAWCSKGASLLKTLHGRMVCMVFHPDLGKGAFSHYRGNTVLTVRPCS